MTEENATIIPVFCFFRILLAPFPVSFLLYLGFLLFTSNRCFPPLSPQLWLIPPTPQTLLISPPLDALGQLPAKSSGTPQPPGAFGFFAVGRRRLR